MRLHVLYRLYPGESQKRRPAFHSKAVCLASLLRSVALVDDVRLTVLVDAPELPDEFATLLRGSPQAEVVHLGGLGNVGSHHAQLDRVRSLPAADLVYLAEDDYLYLPEALPGLVAAAVALPAVDYFTLYDHPDRYVRDDDARIIARPQVWVAGDRHWRRVESTCMSYGARVAALQQDDAVHRQSRWQYPQDRRIWRMTQGLGRWWWRRPKHVLASPVPSLATHMDNEFLAPLVDWAAVAAEVAAGIDARQ